MKDFDNNPLQVGDLVAFLPSNYRHMVKGRVVGFTPKMVRIEKILDEKTAAWYTERNRPFPTELRDHGYLVKLPQ
jgi:hypothetical protein